jgi:hypothetical protein
MKVPEDDADALADCLCCQRHASWESIRAAIMAVDLPDHDFASMSLVERCKAVGIILDGKLRSTTFDDGKIIVRPEDLPIATGRLTEEQLDKVEALYRGHDGWVNVMAYLRSVVVSAPTEDQPDLDAELVGLLKKWSDMHNSKAMIAGVNTLGDWRCETFGVNEWSGDQAVGEHPTKLALIAKLRELTTPKPTPEEILKAAQDEFHGRQSDYCKAIRDVVDDYARLVKEGKAVK